MIGLRFAQTLRGNYHLLARPTEERAIELDLIAAIAGVLHFSLDPNARLTGRVRAEGLATDAPIAGTLGLRIVTDRRLPYDLSFVGDDGLHYRLRGQNELSLLALSEAFSALPASLYDAAGTEIARATLRFDLRADLGKMLRSVRPTRG